MSQTYNLPSGSLPVATNLLSNVTNDFETIRSSFSGATAPSNPAPIAGQPWWDTTNNIPMVYNGTAWEPIRGALSTNASGYASFAAAITAIGSVNEVELIVDTNQTINTAVTVTPNIQVKVIGAGKFTASGATHTINFQGHFDAPPKTVFVGFAVGDLTLPRSVPSYPDYWGYTGTNDTVALNCALQANYNMYLMDKEYKTTGLSVTLASVGDRTKDGISIQGLGRHKSFITVLAGGTYGLKFQGLVPATPQGFNETINDLYLSNFGVLGTEYTSSGIDINAGYRVKLNDIYSSGHKYGLDLRNCINVGMTGIMELTGNNVAIKNRAVDTSGSATIDTYNFGNNVVDIGLLIARSNLYGAISIGAGQTWTIGTILAENTPVTFYMIEQCNTFTVDNLYLENNATPTLANHAIKSQFGDYRFWAMYQGMDEDGNTSTVGLNRNITFHNIYDTNNHLMHLYGMEHLKANYLATAGGYEKAGDCSFIYVDTLGNYKEISNLTAGVGTATKNKIGLKSGYNLVANGFNLFPNFAAPDSTGAVTRTQKQMDDTGNTNVVQLTLAIGAASVAYKIYLPRTSYGDYDDRNHLQLLAEAHVKASNARVTNIEIRLTNQAGGALGYTSLTDYTNPAKTSTNWNTLTTKGSCAITDNPTGSYLLITATRTDTSIEDYLYIAEVMVRDTWNEYIVTPSPFDILAGFCYRGTTSISDAGRYYVQFTVPLGLNYASYYEVVAVAYSTANEGATVVKSDGSFRVYTTNTGINVVAQLIPLQAISS